MNRLTEVFSTLGNVKTRGSVNLLVAFAVLFAIDYACRKAHEVYQTKKQKEA